MTTVTRIKDFLCVDVKQTKTVGEQSTVKPYSYNVCKIYTWNGPKISFRGTNIDVFSYAGSVEAFIDFMFEFEAIVNELNRYNSSNEIIDVDRVLRTVGLIGISRDCRIVFGGATGEEVNYFKIDFQDKCIYTFSEGSTIGSGEYDIGNILSLAREDGDSIHNSFLLLSFISALDEHTSKEFLIYDPIRKNTVPFILNGDEDARNTLSEIGNKIKKSFNNRIDSIINGKFNFDFLNNR